MGRFPDAARVGRLAALHAQDIEKSGYFCEIFFYRLSHLLATETGCRVHDWENVPSVGLTQASPNAANGLTGQKARRRKPAQCNNQARVDQFDLAIEVFAASADFGRGGIPIIGRSTLDHIGNEHLVTGHADGLQK
jgi:hypothetical protein